MVQDLLETDLNKQDHILEQMAFGGAPPPSQLPGHVQKTLAAKVATYAFPFPPYFPSQTYTFISGRRDTA